MLKKRHISGYISNFNTKRGARNEEVSKSWDSLAKAEATGRHRHFGAGHRPQPPEQGLGGPQALGALLEARSLGGLACYFSEEETNTKAQGTHGSKEVKSGRNYLKESGPRPNPATEMEPEFTLHGQ